MWREFRHLDLTTVVDRSFQEMSYGETPTVTLARLLELAKLEPESRILDLGAGRGGALLAAALMGYRVAGIEIVEEYVAGARRVATSLGLQIDFRTGDILQDKWPDADLVLLNSTAFPSQMRAQLAARLSKVNATIVTYDWELDGEHFQQTEALRLPVTRGTVLCRLYGPVNQTQSR